jgi:hypothetical protein
MARFLIILMLVWQPMTLLASGAPAGSGSPAIPMACCKPVEALGCCGEPVIEPECAMTGGPCRCGLAPVQPETPTPALPISNPTERTLAPMPLVGGFAAASVRNLRVTRPAVHGRSSGSQGSTRAFLGIWLT